MKLQSKGRGFESRRGCFFFLKKVISYVHGFSIGCAKKCEKKSEKNNFDSPVVMHQVSFCFGCNGFQLTYVISGVCSL